MKDPSRRPGGIRCRAGQGEIRSGRPTPPSKVLHIRKSWILIALAVPGVAVASLGLWYLVRYTTLTRDLGRYRKDVHAQAAQLRAADKHRPPLFGPPVEGNAWDLYRPALQSLLAMSNEETNVFPSLNYDEHFEPDPAAQERVLLKYGPAIKQIRAALARTWVDAGLPYEEGLEMGDPNLAAIVHAARVLGDAAKLRHDAGRDGEAVELTLMTIGMGCDTTRNAGLTGQLLGRVVGSSALKELREVLSDHDLSADDLKRLGASLARIESFQTSFIDALRIDAMLYAFTLLRVADENFEGEEWNTFNGDRAHVLEALQDLEQITHFFEQRLAPADLVEPIESSFEGPVSGMILPAWVCSFRVFKVNQAKVRLARAAAAVAWYSERHGRTPTSLQELVPDFLSDVPQDPFSRAPLLYSRTATSATLYSYGPDGDDDGGRHSSTAEYPDGDGDLVWTVQRRAGP